jgi:hypothetical protein
LARPFSSGSVTLAFSTCRPPAAAETALARSAFARGVNQIATRTPSRATLSGPSQETGRNIVIQETA